MTRKNKQEIRRSRRRRLQSIVGGAAAVAAPLFGNATVADAELIEYTAEIDVTTAFGVANTDVDDTMSFRATIETDNIVVSVDGGVTSTSAPFESFEYSVDGNATEIWRGYGGELVYQDDPNGDNRFLFDILEDRIGAPGTTIHFGGTATYDQIGEFGPNQVGTLEVIGEDSIFTSFHPSGMPLTLSTELWGETGLSFRIQQFSAPTIKGFATSFNDVPFVEPGPDPEPDPEPEPEPNLCIIGDANCDGFVDIGGDILPAFTNFTGPGSFGKTRVQGDVHGPIVATDNPDGHDGDVDVSDLLTMFGNFTGPGPDNGVANEGGLVAADAGDPNIPDLVYDPTTGEVVLDIDGSGIIGYVLKNGTSSFVAGSHVTILGGVTTSLSSELSEAAFSSSVGQNSVGFVFPTGLDLAGLGSLLSINEVSRSLGAPVVPFDLVVLGPAVPEPSTAILAATAGLAGLMALRKRRKHTMDNLEG